MKTAGRENPNRWTILSSNRAPGAGGQNRSCSIQWAAKQEKFRPMQECFFLTSTFIELLRTWPPNRPRIERVESVGREPKQKKSPCVELVLLRLRVSWTTTNHN